MPDENIVELLAKPISIKTAIELGCGEGRNAIYMAKQGISVTMFLTQFKAYSSCGFACLRQRGSQWKYI